MSVYQYAAAHIGIPLTIPLVDQSSLGSFWIRVNVTIGTSDTDIIIQLQRQPSCYIIVRSDNGAGVFDGSLAGSDWTPGKIVLRATTSTVVSMLVG
jgi:hypothetical protein